MGKVELAKMLGLKLNFNRSIDKWSLAELMKNQWNSLDYIFNADIVVTLEQEDLAKDCLDITEEDLVRPEDLKVCINQVNDLLWGRAADKYLDKIANLVETIKI